MGKPRLTMRSTSGSGDWKAVWNNGMKAISQNFIFYGNVHAQEACERIRDKAKENIVSNISYHLRDESAFVEMSESKKSTFVGWKVLFNTTRNANSGNSSDAFNYAYKVHEDGTSANFHFLKNAYDELKESCLRDIADGLKASLGSRKFGKIFGGGK